VNNKVFDALQNGPKTVDQVKKEAGAARRFARHHGLADQL
jgi:hypothetical protein